MNDALKFINYINDNYDVIKQEITNYSDSIGKSFDEDIFQDTILKSYLLIEKQGKMKDNSNQGIKNYLFQAYKTNLKREQQYSRNSKRDGNVVNLNQANEHYQNSKLTEEEKLKADLKKDFATLYLMHKAEERFDNESFYLFKLKTFTNYTYKQLAEYTGLPSVRQKVVNVKNWLKQNVTKEEIDKAFELKYGDLILE